MTRQRSEIAITTALPPLELQSPAEAGGLPALSPEGVDQIVADFLTGRLQQRHSTINSRRQALMTELRGCDPQSRVAVVAALYEIQLGLRLSPMPISSEKKPGILDTLSPLAQALLTPQPPQPSLPARLESPQMPAIRSSQDVLIPEILDPVLKRGQTDLLTQAIAQLPTGKPRQVVFDAILEQGVRSAVDKKGSLKPRRLSRVVSALTKIDDTVDEVAADSESRPKAYAYLLRSLSHLSHRDPESFRKVIQSLPTKTLLDLHQPATDLWTEDQIVSVIRVIANRIRRDSEFTVIQWRTQRVADTRLDPNLGLRKTHEGSVQRGGFYQKDASHQDMLREQHERGLELLGALLEIVSARDEDPDEWESGIAENVMRRLLSTKAEARSYVLAPIIELAQRHEHEAAIKLLGLNSETSKIAADREGLGEEDLAAFFAQGNLFGGDYD